MDDTLDPDLKDDIEDDIDDAIILGIGAKKAKVPADEDESIDAIAEEEELLLPEDRFDDVEPEDLW